MKILYLILPFVGFCSIVNSQTINIHSITTARQSSGDAGYTLDGGQMASSSRLKLLNTSNFGINGTYGKKVSIFDGYGSSGSLTAVSNLQRDNIFFFGSFNKIDFSIQPFTDSELDSLYNWSKSGGKLIISSVAAIGAVYDARVLNAKWNYTWNAANPSKIIPNSRGNSTDIFNGPFGVVTIANQSGSAQGHFSSIPNNSKVFGTDANGNPTLFMDCSTLDLIIADVDSYTIFGGITTGNSIDSSQDRFWANTIAFMDRLQPLPAITNNAGFLSLNSSYVSYQWFKDGAPISNDATIKITGDGTYYVEVEFNGGCKATSGAITTANVNTNALKKRRPCEIDLIRTKKSIRISGITSNKYYKIYDIIGQEMKDGLISNLMEIDITQLKSGIYFLALDEKCSLKFLKY